MENQSTVKSTASSYGLTLGVVLTVFLILLYAFSLEMLTKWWIRLFEFAAVLIIAIMAMAKSKKKCDSLFTYKNSFTAYFLVVLIGLLIYHIVSYVLFNFIDPEAAQYVLEKAIEMSRSMMESFGAPQDQIDKAIEEMGKQNQFSLKNQAIGFAFSLAFYSVIGLLVALIFREKETTH